MVNLWYNTQILKFKDCIMVELVSRECLQRIFNEEAMLASMFFPEKAKNLLICDTRKLLYISDNLVRALTNQINDVRELIDSQPEIKKIIKERRQHIKNEKIAAVVSRDYTFIDRDINVIAINENVEFFYKAKKHDINMHLVSNFLHEIGHLICKKGYYTGWFPSLESSHLGECVAEAYKALRHKQLFGSDTDYADVYNYSHCIVLGISPIHYVDAINQKVEALSEDKDVDFSKLSFAETVELAGEIASKYCFEVNTINKIKRAYNPVAKLYKTKGKKLSSGVVRRSFNCMMKNTDNPDIYRAGRRFLERSKTKQYINDKHPFWVKAKKRMSTFEKESGIVLDIGIARDKDLKGKVITKDNLFQIVGKVPILERISRSFKGLSVI